MRYLACRTAGAWALLAVVGGLLLSGCRSGSSATSSGGGQSGANGAGITLVAGSECRELQPLFDQFKKESGIQVTVTYTGSLDISEQLSEPQPAADAYLPSNSLWLNLGDTAKRVKNVKSIARTYVVFGVKRSVAQRLGWVGKRVTVADILAAAQAGKLRYCMTSASQSNSGASAYFGYLYAFAGHPETLKTADLDRSQVRKQIKAILGTVNRSAGSSGFLQDLFLSKYDDFDGMVNYESVIIATNQKLVAQGREPLYVVYPVDGLAIADYPLGFVDHGDRAKAEVFHKFQDFLLSADAQQRIAGMGWRTSPIGMQVTNADPAVFNTDWGIETKRVFSPIRFPGAATIRQALDLYQTSFRKPSFTIYCLDNSGSMGQNGGSEQLKAGMRLILDQDQARRQFLQASKDDVTVVIIFNGGVASEWRVAGNNPDQLRALLARINTLQPEGSTNLYGALKRAYEILQSSADLERYSPAVVLMTDGQDTVGLRNDYETMRGQANRARGVPVYSIAYGSDADKNQLTGVAQETSGRFFDGKNDLKSAFREVKGYN